MFPSANILKLIVFNKKFDHPMFILFFKVLEIQEPHYIFKNNQKPALLF